jgi:gamma-glutamylcyclotransferase (GGCT)/AIG2-like uncharacterized protein YtfP
VPSAPEDYLFVYGTLRSDSGHPMNEVLQGYGGRVGPGRVRGALYDLGRYPGAVETRETAAFVHGEVYLLRDPGRDLEALDRYEGLDEERPESGEFRRSRTVVDLDDGRTVAAWIYLYNRPTAGLARVRSGDYRALRSE